MFHLDTPLGTISLTVDGKAVVPDRMWDGSKRFDADHNLRVAYRHVPDGGSHEIECALTPSHGKVECWGSLGQDLEAVEATDGVCGLAIGVEWESEDILCESAKLGRYCVAVPLRPYCEYEAGSTDRSVYVRMPADAKEQWVVFGVVWVDRMEDEDDSRAWFACDPIGERHHVPVSSKRLEPYPAGVSEGMSARVMWAGAKGSEDGCKHG